MIINKDQYRCPQCKKFYLFETSKEYNAFCTECKITYNRFRKF